MIDMRPRLANDLKEFCHKAEAVGGSVQKSFDINGDLIWVSITYSSNEAASLDIPHSTI